MIICLDFLLLWLFVIFFIFPILDSHFHTCFASMILNSLNCSVLTSHITSQVESSPRREVFSVFTFNLLLFDNLDEHFSTFPLLPFCNELKFQIFAVRNECGNGRGRNIENQSPAQDACHDRSSSIAECPLYCRGQSRVPSSPRSSFSVEMLRIVFDEISSENKNSFCFSHSFSWRLFWELMVKMMNYDGN